MLNAVGFPGDCGGIVCNLTPPDPVLREIFHKTDFRIGVSYAMDREEMIVHYLNEVGIKAVSKVDDRSLWDVRKNNYQVEMTLHGWPGNPFTAPYNIIPLDRYSELFGEYGVWVETNGEQGIEPTGDVAKLAPLWQDVNGSRTESERMANLEKIYDLYHENLWIIGLYSGGQPSYFVVNDKLRNVKEGQLNTNYMRSPNNLKPWQLYYEQ